MKFLLPNLGDAGAQCNVGAAYRDGQGVQRSNYEAVKRYRKAAEQGDATSMLEFRTLPCRKVVIAALLLESTAVVLQVEDARQRLPERECARGNAQSVKNVLTCSHESTI